MAVGHDLIQEWFNRVWLQADLEAPFELMLEAAQIEGLGSQLRIGPQQFSEFQQALLAQLEAVEITIDKCLEQDDWASALCTLRARSRRNGADIAITGSVFIRHENGKMPEAYNHWDYMSLWGQLDLLPEDAFEQALRGQKVSTTGS